MTINLTGTLPRYGRVATAASVLPIISELRTWANLVTLIRTVTGLALFTIAFFYLNYLALHPEAAIVIALFLGEFMILDQYLSNQFLRWPILSPNYFYAVDETIWRLNWSPPGKFFNSGAVTLVLLATGLPWAVAPILVGLYA